MNRTFFSHGLIRHAGLFVLAALLAQGCDGGSKSGGDGGIDDGGIDDGGAGTPCATANGGCDPLVTCDASSGSVVCGSCPSGYSGTGATSCVDVDECAAATSPCDPLVTCTNVAGGFTCGTCPMGYAGGGESGCVDIDECMAANPPCDPLATCTNTPGAYTCGSCPMGYTGDGDVGCTDVDECMAPVEPCDALTMCTNTPGTFTCSSCPTGYSGSGDTSCVEIDECATDTDTCADVADCTNTTGSFTCTCHVGYTGDGDTTSTGCNDLADILHYRFDGTGTSVPNLATNPPAGTETATLMGGLTQGAGGECGGAVIGSGNASSTDYVNTGWTTQFPEAWTISFWTKDIVPSSTLFYIFGDAGASSFRCFTNGVAGPNNWILRGPFTDVVVQGGATVDPHVVTFVYDPVAAAIRGYLDGALVTTVAQPAIAISGAGPFKVIGYASNVGAPMDGKLDEFRLYGRALSDEEVALAYTTSQVCR